MALGAFDGVPGVYRIIECLTEPCFRSDQLFSIKIKIFFLCFLEAFWGI